MTGRTRVGIAEWAQRVEQARLTEMWLAESSAARVGEAPDATAKVALVRQARLHAGHAELWKSVVPVLHDVSVDDVAVPGAESSAIPESVLEALDGVYRTWRAEAEPVADVPFLRVLGLVMRDHDETVVA